MEVKLGIYLHYKNKKYEVLGTCRHSETNEEMVLYETLYKNPKSKLWVRPKNMFLEEIVIDNKKVPRFKFISTK